MQSTGSQPSKNSRIYAALIEFLAKETLERDKLEQIFPPLELFLVALRGENTAHLESKLESNLGSSPEGRSSIEFVKRAASAISMELENMPAGDKSTLDAIHAHMQDNPELISSNPRFREALWRLFCPEALEYVDARAKDAKGQSVPSQSTDVLRKKRTITDVTPNPEPICNPVSEILFTSNVLLTIPSENQTGGSTLPDDMQQQLRFIEKQGQQYWYDHPMPVGIKPEASELLYGLRELSNMLQWEKEQGNVDEKATLSVLLSLSVTHTGLSKIAPEYIRLEMEAAGAFPGLAVYVISEEESKEIAAILQELLSEAGSDSGKKAGLIADIFGVDGMYGRHYSFLKAAAPLFACLNPAFRATFKIDLDQVFPQKELSEQSGKSALQHFCTELWGAVGKDSSGQAVDLGMIAGALVNEADIAKGLFTPDVNYPAEPLAPIDVLFPRSILMAYSTRAEMMTRYAKTQTPDGEGSCLQRVHVTGGTNGILFSSLRKHRPFTPSFIGRAEDQAYLMSAYTADTSPSLRYVHEPGLIMRHDKSSFASDAIKQAKLGTYAGDLLRTVVFSRYAACLPGGLAAFKQFFSPFTSCFTSSIPLAASIGRLMLHCCTLYQQEQNTVAQQQLHLAALALDKTLDSVAHSKEIHDRYLQEKQGWQCYYDAMDLLFAGSTAGSKARERIKRVLENCLIQV